MQNIIDFISYPDRLMAHVNFAYFILPNLALVDFDYVFVFYEFIYHQTQGNLITCWRQTAVVGP